MPQPYNIFTIYAREDAKLLSELLSQLKPLEISGRIKVWSDREINPGVQWEQEIVSHLDTADIILILVSPAYYNSEYIHREEITRAMQRHNRGEAKVLPIIVRPCSFEDDPVVSSLQLLPTDGKAVTDDEHWRSQDKAWLDVVNGLKRTLAVLLAAESRREQAALAAEQAAERKKEKEERQGKTALPVPWGRYITIGVGALTLLLAVWLLVKMFNAKKEQTAQNQALQPDTTQLFKSSQLSEGLHAQPPPTVEKKTSISFNYPMVRVTGGAFNMGNSASEAGRRNDECQHTVTVGSFSIGKYEVTQAQWKTVMGNNPSHFKGCDDCPVESVSWNVVQEFIEKLNITTGKRYRLPREIEWEFAAKGGSKTRNYKYAGSDNLDSVAWYSANSDSRTHPVGRKSPNELDLHDMSGNVWEWCQDTYKPYPCDSKNKADSSRRCLRGGSWGGNGTEGLRPSDRNNNDLSYSLVNTGFRLSQD